MENSLIEDQLTRVSIQLSFFEGIWILLISLTLGLYIRFLYNKFSITYSSKISFGNTILLVVVSVASLIAVVKTSLALSLGLVGALSVIRFRTAVKEPYNLAIMLFAICTGISIGASQFIFALQIIVIGSLAIIYSYKSSRSNKPLFSKADEIDTISLSLPSNISLSDIYKVLSENTDYYTILSVDQEENKELNLVVSVKISNQESLSKLKDILFDNYPGSNFSFYNTPSI